LIPSVFRGLAKPAKRGTLLSLIRSFDKKPVFTKAGIYLGDASTYDVDIDRLARVTNRIVKGLFYHEFSSRLPDSYGVRSFAESAIDHFTLDQRSLIAKLALSISRTPKLTIGERIFEYWYSPAPEDTRTTAWVLRFFESVVFLCLTADTVNKRPAA
jgi:hypothetical protein